MDGLCDVAESDLKELFVDDPEIAGRGQLESIGSSDEHCVGIVPHLI